MIVGKKEVKDIKVNEKYIRWFSSLGKDDVSEVGGKAANLGEMYNLGLPVPQGFAILASAYNYFLEETGIKEKIYEILNRIDIQDTKELDDATKEIRELVTSGEMPQDLQREIIDAYENLSVDKKTLEKASYNVLSILRMQEPAFVAVRSSATAEDSAEASFAGQQETYLNVKGKDRLIASVKKCFASLFTSRSVYYRVRNNFKHESVLIAVVVQEMINSDKSGVIFTKDPINDTGNVVVEAVFGLGEGIVSGRIEPDHYVVSKDLKIIEKRTAEKKIALVRDSSGNNGVVKLMDDKSKQQVLNDYEIKKLADYGLRLEEHYKKPQDIEFAISSNEIFIVQTRPITTLGKKVEEKQEMKGKEILSGQSASPGVGSGEVKIVRKLEDLQKIIKGDILVTEMTNPDMVVTMQKAAAIVTDEGGMTSHAAIVSREMGIPCVVGTKIATKKLYDGLLITVNGFNGKIYEGKMEELKSREVEVRQIVKTKTRIKVIVDLPDFAGRAAKTGCNQVGLTRLEGIIAESGKHPFYFVKNKEISSYEEIIYLGVSKIAEHFDELWIRTSDIRSDEFKNLQGSSQHPELNPMLGMHGIRFSLKHKDILKAELKALSRVADNHKKIGVMMPQVISLSELTEVKKILKELGIENLKLGVMIETPAAVQIIEDLCKEGISFISFGTNDLTQYTLAVDRGNEQVQYLYDEMHPSVLLQLAYVISVCNKFGVETSICGQAASSEKMVDFLVRAGIDSLSVNADRAYDISEFVKKLEEEGFGRKFRTDKAERMEERIEEKGFIVNCNECKKETRVPFKPDGIRPVYCKVCLEKKRQEKLLKKNVEKVEEKESAIKKIGEKAKEIVEKVENIVTEEIKEIVKGKSEEIKEDNKIEGKKQESFYEATAEELIEASDEELDIF